LGKTLSCNAIVDEGLVERYLARTLSEAEVDALESHYLTCARCQTDLRLGAAIRAVLPEVQQALRNANQESVARPRLGRRVRIGAVAGALAAVLAGILLVRPADLESPQHRQIDSETEIIPSAETPVGDVATLEEFRWTPVISADLYEVTLYDSAGGALWQAESRETHAALPDSVRLEADVLYLWQVNARVGWDRWVASELVRFRIAAR
jgi:hypothetical protein